jgi:hypothetical protein
MSSLFTNWKTTLAGVLTIALGAASAFIPNFAVPGFTNVGLIPAVVTGLGLIFAQDQTALVKILTSTVVPTSTTVTSVQSVPTATVPATTTVQATAVPTH